MTLVVLMSDAIIRLSAPASQYRMAYEDLLRDEEGRLYSDWCILRLGGIVHALREAHEHDYLTNITELIHGELFDDFIEMATHLLEEGYKDAAAVISGSVLEGHLRTLCTKHSIPVALDDIFKKAERLNNDLKAAEAYSKGDHKSVTAWLDIRNNAAHGHYEKYTKEQVGLLQLGLRDFISRIPA